MAAKKDFSCGSEALEEYVAGFTEGGVSFVTSPAAIDKDRAASDELKTRLLGEFCANLEMESSLDFHDR